MSDAPTLGQWFTERGISRRTFLKYGSYMASLLALPPMAGRALAQGLEDAQRQSVIWYSFQECTACSEALTRSHSPTVEDLIFDFISLDYSHLLQAAAGHAALKAKKEAMERNYGKYLLVVDGSLPIGENAIYSCSGGHSNQQDLESAVDGAAAVIAVGTCAAFGGIPKANPNPTGAVAVRDVVFDKPIINISGCPPVPIAITGVLSHFLAFGSLPELDHLGRPLAFFGENIHDRCYRRPYYEAGKFAKSFDDEGARQGYCLYEVGCKGPVAYNACATLKWNGGTSWPVESGHGCFACSEPGFWDRGGLYRPLSAGVLDDTAPGMAAAAAVGVAAGAGAAVLGRKRREAAAAKIKDVNEAM